MASLKKYKVTGVSFRQDQDVEDPKYQMGKIAAKSKKKGGYRCLFDFFFTLFNSY